MQARLNYAPPRAWLEKGNSFTLCGRGDKSQNVFDQEMKMRRLDGPAHEEAEDGLPATS
jgi:hypothetical protein